MSGYNKQDWVSRFHVLGDPAEEQFITWALDSDLKVERLGWNRPKVSMRKMSDTLKHMPDFYSSDGYLYEVMGCGKDKKVKLKTTKKKALETWNEIQPVRLWVWNSYYKEILIADIDHVIAVWSKARTERFHDGPYYRPLSWSKLDEAT